MRFRSPARSDLPETNEYEWEHEMTTNPHDTTPSGTSASEPDIDEQDIPVDIQVGGAVCLTPVSAVGGLEVNSPAGSGPMIYPDFRTAIRDAWGTFELDYAAQGKPRMGEALPIELREGRQAFKSLLDRYEREGFDPDLAQELNKLCCKYTPYRIVDISYVLPDGLNDLLDTAYGGLDEEDVEVVASTPPRDEFNLDNPEHLEWLAKQLDYWEYI